MLPVETLIGTYGYLAVGLGTLVEGETVMLIAGFLAHRGYLSVVPVFIAGFVGTILSDQVLFFLGRYKGKQLLKKFSGLERRFEKINQLLYRNQNVIIFWSRFLFGLRTATAITLGMSRISTKRFLFVNALSTAVWALVVGGVGYFIGTALQGILGTIEHIELEIVGVMIGVSLIVWTITLTRNRER